MVANIKDLYGNSGYVFKRFFMKYTFPLKKTVGWTALTSLEDCAAASTAMGDVLSIVNVWFVGSGEGLPSPLHWKVSRPPFERGWVRSIEHTISILSLIHI